MTSTRRSECTHEWQLSSFDIRFWRCAACGAWQYLQDGSHPSQHPMPSRAAYDRMNRTTDVTNKTPESNEEITGEITEHEPEQPEQPEQHEHEHHA